MLWICWDYDRQFRGGAYVVCPYCGSSNVELEG